MRPDVVIASVTWGFLTRLVSVEVCLTRLGAIRLQYREILGGFSHVSSQMEFSLTRLVAAVVLVQ